MTLRKLCKDIPDYLLNSSHQGDQLRFQKEELGAFAEVPLVKKPSRWRRVISEHEAQLTSCWENLLRRLGGGQLAFNQLNKRRRLYLQRGGQPENSQ